MRQCHFRVLINPIRVGLRRLGCKLAFINSSHAIRLDSECALVIWTPPAAPISHQPFSERPHPRVIKSAGFLPVPPLADFLLAGPQSQFASRRYPLKMARQTALNYMFCNSLALILTILLAVAEVQGQGPPDFTFSSGFPRPTGAHGPGHWGSRPDRNNDTNPCFNDQ